MGSDITPRYAEYHEAIRTRVNEQYDIANKAKATGLDPSTIPESLLATDLADRVEKLLDIPVANRLRELRAQTRTETVALTIASEVASGKYQIRNDQSRAEAAVRIGLAIITDGITVAPIQGVSAVRTKTNSNGTEYLSVEFAGPMRSAGGTESALTLVIADQVRKVLGFGKYNPNAFDDEIGRFIEELRVYERDVGTFQYRVTDEDLARAITNLPVEIDGVWTDNYEVVVHRNMKRISTNRLRGGALRVLNDGIIGKSKKLSSLLPQLGITDWSWLSELSGGNQQGTDETKQSSSHFDEVISGRPVLSKPNVSGAFRLRYGRAMNTGIHGVGIHPSLAALLSYPIVTGTQIKVDIPGKAATVAFVDTIEPPIVKLNDGTIIHIRNAEHAISVASQVETIVYLGDLLVSYGDFLENNVKLVPSGYVEEWWAQDLNNAINNRYSSLTSASAELNLPVTKLQALLQNKPHTFPTAEEALRISEILDIPLYPKYLLYWDQLSPEQIIELRGNVQAALDSQLIQAIDKNKPSLTLDSKIKPILELLGLDHSILGTRQVTIGAEDTLILLASLGLLHKQTLDSIPENWTSSTELVSKLSGIKIREKSSTFVGVRVGRPEKAAPRKMRPPVEGLFPVGKSAGLSRDILATAERNPLPTLQIVNLECPKCGISTTTSKCPICNTDTHLFKTCIKCNRKESDETRSRCVACGSPLTSWSSIQYKLAQDLKSASSRVGYNPEKPLKGVLRLTNELKIPERLEKVLLRQKHGLSVYRDGTIRYDVTNVPLTHFRPRQIQTTIGHLKDMGYTKNIHGEALEQDDQILELMAQDIILPYEAGTFLLSVSKFIDDLLQHHYQKAIFYGASSPEDLIGQLIIGLAPHTSVGIVGRIIGYTNAQACFAHPYWHSAKRRDCDGDGDSIMLLMDPLLNFSKKFLPSIIGGLMDAPLLIQPIVLPTEVQRQAHHMDVRSFYPISFYEAASKNAAPADVSKEMDILKNRLETERQYEGFRFTHDTSSITVKQNRSSYSTLTTLDEKLERQIQIAEKIRAVNPNEVVRSVLRTHILPDIIGNTKAFTSQKFRCKSCGTKYRRIPLRGNCLECGGELRPTVTRGSVEKYLQLGLSLAKKYDVGEYLRSRFILAAEELATLFKPEGHQTDMKDYFSSPAALPTDSLIQSLHTPSKPAQQQELMVVDSTPKSDGRAKIKQVKRKEEYQTTLV